MSLYNGPPRPGARGGRDQFSWDNVKADKDREYYLGHSVKALAGRWQKGRDVYWYTREKEGQYALQDEVKAVKQREEDLMMEALGLKPKTAIKPAPQLDKHDLDELIKGKPQDDQEQQQEGGVGAAQEADRIKGLGFISGAGGPPSEAVHVTLPGVGPAVLPAAAGFGAGAQQRLPPPAPGPVSGARPGAALALASGVTAVQLKEMRRAEKRAKKEAKKAKKTAKKAAKKAKREGEGNKERGGLKPHKKRSRSSSPSRSSSGSSSAEDDGDHGHRGGGGDHRRRKYDNAGDEYDRQQDGRSGLGSRPAHPQQHPAASSPPPPAAAPSGRFGRDWADCQSGPGFDREGKHHEHREEDYDRDRAWGRCRGGGRGPPAAGELEWGRRSRSPDNGHVRRSGGGRDGGGVSGRGEMLRAEQQQQDPDGRRGNGGSRSSGPRRRRHDSKSRSRSRSPRGCQVAVDRWVGKGGVGGGQKETVDGWGGEWAASGRVATRRRTRHDSRSRSRSPRGPAREGPDRRRGFDRGDGGDEAGGHAGALRGPEGRDAGGGAEWGAQEPQRGQRQHDRRRWSRSPGRGKGHER